MPPGQPAIIGPAAHQWTRDLMAAVTIELGSYEDHELFLVGDRAIHRYGFRWTVTAEG